MNIIRRSSGFSIIFILAVALSSLIYGCSGGGASEPSFFNDNPGDNPQPPIIDLLSNPQPPAPVITTAEATTNSVFLDWIDESSRESGFIIVRDGIKVGETDRNISQWTDLSVLPATTYTYLVVAWNKEGEGVSQAKLVTTPPLPTPPPPTNHSPTISSISATPASVETGEPSSIACQASDSDNDPLTFSWSATAGTISGSGANTIWTAPASAGTYTIQCEVSDGRGGSDAKSVSVAVTKPPPPINHSPVISSVSATPASVETGKQSSIACSASDPDNDPLSYSWSATAGTISGSGANTIWTAPASAGNYTIQCSVSDGQGGSKSGVTDIVVTNPIPVQTKWQLPSGVNIRSLATDQATGELYAAGSTTTAPNDVFLAKFNPDGTLAWEKQWGTAGYDFDWDIKVFASEVFLLWVRNGTYGIGDGEEIISRYDSAGNEIAPSIIIGNFSMRKIAVDDTGIYLSMLRKLDYNGALLWLPPSSSPDYSAVSGADVVVHNGAVYFVGLWRVALSPPKVFTIALNSTTGSSVWAAEWSTGNLADSNNGNTVTVNSSGVYTGGWWGFDSLTPPDQGGGSNPPRCLILRHDLSGNLLWTHQDTRAGSFNQIVSDDDAAYALGSCGLTKITNDGAFAWQTSVTGQSLSLFNNVLYAANDSNIIRRYDALTGNQIP